MNPKTKFRKDTNANPTVKPWGNIKWTANTQHVDIDTGELLTPTKIKQNDYIKITLVKDYQISKDLPHGHITYTYLYRHGQQLKLF